MSEMRKAAAIAAVTALLLKGAVAADFSDPVPIAFPTSDPDQANWHGGGHRRGGGGHGGGDGGSGDGGSVIIGFPYPSGPDVPNPYPPSPYPYPGKIPPAPPAPRGRPPAGGNIATNQPQPWPVWYYCDQPNGYYPYVKVCTDGWQRLPVMPPPPGSGPPVADGLWERCDKPEGYFPYVGKCRLPWVAMPASSPVPGDDPEGIPVIGQWFYCEDAKDYLPYVGSCPHVWRSIPAVPPPNVQTADKSKTAANPR
jgi:hypothetical protein